MVWEQLKEELIFPKLEASNSKEVFEQVGGKFIEEGFCKDSYVDALVNRESEFPTGIDVDGFGIAIPHTRPEKGSLKIGCSLITLKEPVHFEGDESAVKVLICFSAVDNASHLDVLRMIMEFINEGMIDEIANVDTYDELIKLINN